jgi:hypothetical protein
MSKPKTEVSGWWVSTTRSRFRESTLNELLVAEIKKLRDPLILKLTAGEQTPLLDLQWQEERAT